MSNRITTLTSQTLPKIVQSAERGLTDEEIGKEVGVAKRTLNAWIKKGNADVASKVATIESVLVESLARVRTAPVDRLKNVLYQAATEKRIQYQKEWEKDGAKHTIKEVLPDTKVAMDLLKAFSPEEFRERVEIGFDFGVTTENAPFDPGGKEDGAKP